MLNNINIFNSYDWKNKYYFMFCKYFGMNWNIWKFWFGYGMFDIKKFCLIGMSLYRFINFYFLERLN